MRSRFAEPLCGAAEPQRCGAERLGKAPGAERQQGARRSRELEMSSKADTSCPHAAASGAEAVRAGASRDGQHRPRACVGRQPEPDGKSELQGGRTLCLRASEHQTGPRASKAGCGLEQQLASVCPLTGIAAWHIPVASVALGYFHRSRLPSQCPLGLNPPQTETSLFRQPRMAATDSHNITE